MSYIKNLSEPWFSLIQVGKKTVEGRLNKGDFANMKKNDIIEFHNNDFGFDRKFTIIITDINKYNTFKEYLQNEGLNKCLPTIKKIEDGEKIYYKYYSKEDENLYKIVAIKFKIKK